MIFVIKHWKIARCANLIGICVLCILLIITIVQYRQLSSCPAGKHATIADVLVAQRAKIALEMKNFDECFGVDARELSNMTPETKGTPVRSIVISSWRTGSTFLGDILNAMPGNFYHYEPLFNFGIKQIRDKEESAQAIENIKRFLYCNYTDLSELDLAKYYFSHNEHLSSVCKDFPHICRRPLFLTHFCKLFPIQSMKTVRLRLSLAKQLLEDKDLNVRILLLVRDPRGTMQSRKNCLWCPGIPDCDNIYNLCNDLVSDYQTAEELLKKHRASFRTLRHEDLSINLYKMTEEILQFFGLPFDQRIKNFLDTHTKVDKGGVYSTHRDSKTVPFGWKQYLLIEEIENIQNKCAKAMELWGYRKIEDFYDYQNTFNPLILPPPFA